jgi:hypothetical protein
MSAGAEHDTHTHQCAYCVPKLDYVPKPDWLERAPVVGTAVAPLEPART